jgi:hypothetical protein
MPTKDEDYRDNVDLKSCSDAFRLAGSFDGKLALSLLDQLDLLPALYAECWVPQTVFNEVPVAGLGKPGAKSLQSSDWLARVRVSPRY